MSAGIIRLYPATPGATLGMLYFTNSLGAAAGVLVSVFVLIPAVGLPGTIMSAGILNVLLALVVWGIAKKRHTPALAEPVSKPDQMAFSWLPVMLLTVTLYSSLLLSSTKLAGFACSVWCWAVLPKSVRAYAQRFYPGLGAGWTVDSPPPGPH
ncbi:MAG: hypothetical protein H6975_10780 [Gammaproteobacteria bacterium]|nr:hypothetical protein [Gammaproteobacteria bacterium]